MKVKGVSNWQSNLQLFRGRFQTYGHPKYGLIITKWPRKRGPAKTPTAAINQAMFRQVVQWAKNPLSSEIDAAQEGTKDTGYLLRDVIESSSYGLVTIGVDVDGNVYMGFRLANQQIQVLLDSISIDVGTLLVRTAVGWVALDAGPNGDVLTALGPGAVPQWAPVPSGPAPPATVYMALSENNAPGVNAAAVAFCGTAFLLSHQITLNAIWALQNQTASQSYDWYTMNIAATTTPQTVSNVTKIATQPGILLNRGWTRVALTTPQILTPAAGIYVIGSARTDGTNTSVNGQWKASAIQARGILPGLWLNFGSMAQKAPANGNSLTMDTTFLQSSVLALEYSV